MPFSVAFLPRWATALLLAASLTNRPAQAQTAPAPADVLREITDAVGLKPRFELRASRDVPNAAAVVFKGQRYLLYNPDFLAEVNRAGHTNWAGISILAHEMGHHLNGHTLRTGGSQPADELEADEFSGFVLRKLGASLAEAQAAMAALPNDKGSSTHPGRAPRLLAIGEGWQRANGQVAAASTAAAPSAVPAVVATAAIEEVQAEATEDVVAALHPARSKAERLVGKITFRDNPTMRFYLTSTLKVVRVDAADVAEEVGHLTRTRSSAFPYVLTDAQERLLFITPRGDVYNKDGRRVAKLQDNL